METDRICPNCRKPLPPDVPLGLCPECLIKSGFPTGTEPGSGGVGRFVPPPVEEIAKLFPQFEILSLIGKGGMGAVYKARQPALDRFVALKVLPPAVANDPGFAERFNREARALARLSHPNIVVVYDFGTAGALNYLVMEFVDGTNLREVEQAGKLSSEQALAIVPQICEALQFAHNEGIVHRDIKPENLLVDKKGRVKITDFGIAKILDVPAGKVALTGAKDVVGTPHYMAPEQIEKPQTVDHRADIYSLGVVFYEMLTGELPLGKFAPPSKKVQVDVRLDEVVLHTLEKEPERRYQQASQVKTDVETIAGTPPTIGRAGAVPPVHPGRPPEATSDKILLPTFLLAFFFGVFGAHRFYVGKVGTGIAQLFTLGGMGIWTTIDWILILCQVFTDKNGRRITNWWHPGPPRAPAPPKMPAPPIAGGVPAGGNNMMIVAPAVALLVAGCMKLFGALMALLFLQFDWRVASLATTFKDFGFSVMPFHMGIFGDFNVILFSVVPALVIIYGAVEMIRIRSLCWAIAAAIVAIIFCNIVGFPAGIWALIVLLQPAVREAFAYQQTPTREIWPWILGVVAAACLFFILMLSFITLLFKQTHAEPLAAHATTHVSKTHKPTFNSQVTQVPQSSQAPAAPSEPVPPVAPVAPAPPAPLTPPTPLAPTATPAPASVPSRDAVIEGLQSALNEAKMELTNVEAQYSIGMTTSEEVDAALIKVKLLQRAIDQENIGTTSSPDPVEVANAMEAVTNALNTAAAAVAVAMSNISAPVASAIQESSFALGTNIAATLQLQLAEVQKQLEEAQKKYAGEIANGSGVDQAGSDEAKAAIKAAQDQLNRAQRFLKEQAARYKNGSIPADEYRRAQDEFAVFASQFKAAEEALRQANVQMMAVPGEWYETNGQTTTFTVTGTGTAPLSYQWFNGSNQTSNVSISVTNEIHSSVVTPPNDDPPPEPTQQTIDIGDSTDVSHSFAVEPDGKFTMDVDRGDVHVTGGNQNTVEIRVERDMTGASDSDAVKVLKEEHVTLKQNGNEISITARNPPSLNSLSHLLWRHPNLNAHYEITVPRNFTVQSKTSGGDTSVAGVQNSVNITTLGGNLDCKDIGGDVDGQTMGGNVRAANCQGKLDLKTMGGNITVDDFSGPNIQASTQGGSVSADFATAPAADCELTTSGGNVIAHLPANAAVTVDAHTEGGSASSDFPISSSHGFVNQTLKGPINGGGPRLKMETMGGMIEVLKR
jgi:TM2 domain-containing membrane protein YozV/predicted Ser/Thr protein kinase